MVRDMDVLYVKTDDYVMGEAAYPHIIKLAQRYAEENGLLMPEDAVIKKTKEGRPEIEGAELDFSVSHSGRYWMCLFSDSKCGLDFQVIRRADFVEIKNRYFNSGEKKYASDELRFFDVWVRREALGKFIGDGMFGTKPDVARGGFLVDDALRGEIGASFHDLTYDMFKAAGITIADDFRAVVLTSKGEVPKIIEV